MAATPSTVISATNGTSLVAMTTWSSGRIDIKEVTFQNPDTVSHVYTMKFTIGGNVMSLPTIYVDAGGTFIYTSLHVLSASGDKLEVKVDAAKTTTESACMVDIMTVV